MVGFESLFGTDGKILRERRFQLLLAANIFTPLGTVLLSPVLDSLIEPYGVSPANIGLMISVYTAPAIVIIPVAGILADRYGRKPVLVSGLVLFGVAGMAVAFTTNFRVALTLRFVQGIGFGGTLPIIIASLGDIYTGTTEATAQGLRFTNSGLAATVFPIASGILVVSAWQYPFLLYGIALPVALLIHLELEEPATANVPTGETSRVRGQVRTLLDLTRQRRVFALMFARGLPVVVWFSFITYNSLFVVYLMDSTPTTAGALVAVGSFAYALAASQAGRLTAILESRLLLLMGAHLCLGVGFVLYLFATGVAIAGVGIVIVGIGFGLTLSLYRSIFTGLADESTRGSLVSLSESFGLLAATATPLAAGAAIGLGTQSIGLTGSLQLMGIGAALFSSVGGIVCLLIVHTSPPLEGETSERK